MKGFVSTVKVVNDSFERDVFLAKNYSRIPIKDSFACRKICQIVEANRKAFVDVNKALTSREPLRETAKFPSFLTEFMKYVSTRKFEDKLKRLVLS